jgi:signal transduction histidine kinase
MIVVLDGLSTAIATFAVLVAYRASRRHDELLHAHNSLLTTRVTELDTFAGRVAHDVLSPLGTIAAALPLIAQSCDSQGRTYIDRSQRALERVQQLVEALLAFARSGAQPDPSARCQVDAVLANVVADLSETAAEKQIELVIEPGDSVQVACSPGAFTSIVQNLVQNAIKYMGAQAARRIVVRAKATGATVRLEVQDTGPGIPADLQARIFDPFVRVTEEQVSGTGLGLATVKRLVESHSGKVGVLSKPESGTLFFVELPRVQAESPDLPVGASIHASDSPRPGDHEADVRPDRSLAGPRAGG